jgi:hypothetical protein
MFRKCEIAIATPATGTQPIESKWCASRAWLVALSGADGALQQFTWLTGPLGEQSAPQQAGVEQVVPAEALIPPGSSRVTSKIARNRTTATLARPQRSSNAAK